MLTRNNILFSDKANLFLRGHKNQYLLFEKMLAPFL